MDFFIFHRCPYCTALRETLAAGVADEPWQADPAYRRNALLFGARLARALCLRRDWPGLPDQQKNHIERETRQVLELIEETAKWPPDRRQKAFLRYLTKPADPKVRAYALAQAHVELSGYRNPELLRTLSVAMLGLMLFELGVSIMMLLGIGG